MIDVTDRDPETQHLATLFAYEHLKPRLRGVSELCHYLAAHMIAALPDGPELTAGLRKLVEAKDCFVRAALPRTGASSGDDE